MNTNTDNVLVVSFNKGSRIIVDIPQGRAATNRAVAITCVKNREGVWSISVNGQRLLQGRVFQFSQISNLMGLFCRDTVYSCPGYRIANNLFASLNGEPIASGEMRMACN